MVAVFVVVIVVDVVVVVVGGGAAVRYENCAFWFLRKIGSFFWFLKKGGLFTLVWLQKRTSLGQIALEYLYDLKNLMRLSDIEAKLSFLSSN